MLSLSQDWVLEELGQEAIAWYNELGRKVFNRHPVNRRTMLATRREYTNGILEHGVVKGGQEHIQTQTQQIRTALPL